MKNKTRIMSRFEEYDESPEQKSQSISSLYIGLSKNAHDVKVVERHGLDMSKHFQLFSILENIT